jgi:alkylated DNA repair dioxygenase AlkB
MNIVPGLIYEDNAISEEVAKDILSWWNDNKDDMLYVNPRNYQSRKYIHYGYKYNYLTRDIYDVTIPIPDVLKKLIRYANRYVDTEFNQCIINHYKPGQGIGKHIDDLAYGEYICCFTMSVDGVLGKDCRTMRFINRDTGNMVDIPTPSGSMYIMSGDARYDWYHQMLARKTDTIDDVKIDRCEMYSITFRNVPNVIGEEFDNILKGAKRNIDVVDDMLKDMDNCLKDIHELLSE